MRTQLRTLVALLVAAPVMTACVTKSTFRREMNERRNEVNEERMARMAADSGLSAEISNLRRDLDTLRTEFGARITAMEEGIKFAFPVNFAFDDATVRPEDQPALDRFAMVAQKYYGGSKITVEGFADPAGTQRYNLDLSRRRAEAVRAYLVGKGMNDVNLATVGYGKTRLINQSKKDETGAELNRRVTFVVETKGDTTASNVTASAMQ
jgi:outer membrane protein OmpA-like peptidoglycan-associated protein